MIAFLNNIAESFVGFLAPKHCLVCNSVIDKENQIENMNYLCNKCYYNQQVAGSSESIINRMLASFEADNVAITYAYSLFSVHQTNFLDVIHHLKYSNLYKVGVEFGEILAQKVKLETDVVYDAIIPVPIHKTKKRERGYNQSTFIAKGVSKVLTCPVKEDLIIRAKYIESQTKMNAKQRVTNVQGIYQLPQEKSFYINKTFLIVDDVFTTGSTINSMAIELLNKGAKRIDCATLGLA